METLLELLLSLAYQIPVTCWRYSAFASRLRFSVRKTAAILISVFFSLNALGIFLGKYENFMLACRYRTFMSLVMIALSLYLIKDHPGKQIFIVAFYINGLFMLTSFCLLAELIIYEDETINHVLFKLLSFSVMMLLLAPVFLKYIHNPLKTILFDCDMKIWNVVWFPALFQCVLALVTTIPIWNIEHISFSSPILRFFISLCGFIFHSSIIYLIKTNMESTRETCELETAKQQLVVQQYQYDKIREEMENSRHFRHDFKHHTAMINAIIEDSQASEHEKLARLSAYCKEYFGSLPGFEEIVYCDNYALNLLLNYYHSKCKESHVEMNIHAHIECMIPIDDPDLCTIVGNILLNAWEAASHADDVVRKIDATISQKNNSLLIVVENGFPGELLPASHENSYLSTKHEGDGLGLPSIISIAKRYGGTCEFGKSASNDHIFCSRIFFLF